MEERKEKRARGREKGEKSQGKRDRTKKWVCKHKEKTVGSKIKGETVR